MTGTWTEIAYIVASVLFILGLKGLTSPKTAVRGNLLGALGMLVAVLAALGDGRLSYGWIAAGLVIGSAIGAYLAITVAMTAMPQLVALFNGFGGIASALVAGAALHENAAHAASLPAAFFLATGLSGLIGSVTFSGSFVAFGKLQGLSWIPGKPVRLPMHQLVNAGVTLLALLLCALIVWAPPALWAYWVLLLVAGAVGVILVIPIGGADMPVVVALLNSYSGLAASATGFVLENTVLIVAGALVGASGLILTRIMCVAMNRSLLDVLFGSMESGAAGPSSDDVYAGKIKRTSPEEVAMLLDGARLVVIVPGYGMAVAQAQHAVRELADQLKARGTEVKYAIHPVAGRMPGHMNVLLAEAEVPYDELVEMEQINPILPEADVAIVLGANDVVNPMARRNDGNPIAGMPIIDVDKAGTVVVIKRSLSPGFAGIPNPLFANDNTLMLFSDGKKAVLEITAALKES
ncbi:MAG: NAD(P)(+) transhydrogenase (Re/Si-specific) subunit beta [Planctomycetota bacterium]|nr:MAG: NAD(P)(+) transhydrogenase (Re/Si-specific) subunit beta [Planctomycetota bacterium]